MRPWTPITHVHPILFHLGRIAIPTQGVLVALGLLAGLQLACSLARRTGVDSNRIWNLGLTSLLTLFLGERLLVIAFNLPDFLAHPFWMLGLATIRDERYLCGGALLGLAAAVGYTLAWQLPWRRVADCMVPGAALALTFVSLGNLAAGADFGRPVSHAWGIVYTSRVAARNAGVPLGVPLLPIALYAAGLYLLAAAATVWLVLRHRPAGTGAAVFLFFAGLGAVLLQQLRYQTPAELLLFSTYTPAQVLGIAGVLLGGLLFVLPQPSHSPVDAEL